MSESDQYPYADHAPAAARQTRTSGSSLTGPDCDTLSDQCQCVIDITWGSRDVHMLVTGTVIPGRMRECVLAPLGPYRVDSVCGVCTRRARGRSLPSIPCPPPP
eukprot:2508422-Rhodomonas_salina.1